MKIEIKEFESADAFRVWVEKGASKLGWLTSKDPANLTTSLSYDDAWRFDEKTFAEILPALTYFRIPHSVVRDCWFVQKEGEP